MHDKEKLIADFMAAEPQARGAEQGAAAVRHQARGARAHADAAHRTAEATEMRAKLAEDRAKLVVQEAETAARAYLEAEGYELHEDGVKHRERPHQLPAPLVMEAAKRVGKPVVRPFDDERDRPGKDRR